MPNIVRPLQLIIFLLLATSLTMVLSSSAIAAMRYGDHMFFFQRQMIWIVIGVAAMLVMSKIPYTFWRPYVPWMVGGTFLLLIAIFIPGVGAERNKATRWIDLKVILIQPAEFAKIAVIFGVAWYLSRKEKPLELFVKDVLPIYAVLGAMFGLVVGQPDFGSAVLLLFIAFVMLYVGGLAYRHFIPLTPFALAGFIALIVFFPYRWVRFVAFRDPWADPQGKGYHIIQSFIALGEGNWFGKGLGQGRQKLNFLPEAHTDFILSIIGEELGVVGVWFVIACFVALLVTCMRLFRHIENTNGDRFASAIVFGYTMVVSVQALMNIAVISGSMPTKGIALPFISFGGSGLVTLLFLTGVVMNIAKEHEATQPEVEADDSIPSVFRPKGS